MIRSRLLVAAASMVLVGEAALGDSPPPVCAGTEPYRFTVQGSADNGLTWNTTYPYIVVYGSAGQDVYLKVRTLLTVATGMTQGWSFSLRHDPSTLRNYGGDMTLEGVTTTGTSTSTVQGGAPPDFDVTEGRSGFDGWMQAIVIDNEQEMGLSPTSDFVTAGACYRIRVPTYGLGWQVTVRFTNDIGSPSVDTLVSQGGQAKLPCARNLTINVYRSTKPPNACSLDGGWLGSRSTGPEIPPDGSGAPDAPRDSPERPLPTPPFSLGDVNADESVNITDGIAILQYLFLGSEELPKVAMLLQTGQTQCYDGAHQLVDCATIGEGSNFWGQDAQVGSGRIRRFEIDGATVKDLATGLMWERNPNRTAVAWAGAAAAAAGRNTGGFSDWRLPTITELLTICEYAYYSDAVWDGGGATARCDGVPCFQLGTSGQDAFPAAAWSSTEYRLVRDEEGELVDDFAWWLWLTDGYTQIAHKSNERGVIGVRTWHTEAPHAGTEVTGLLTDYQLGDANGDLQLNITDAIYVLNYLFLGSELPPKLVLERPVLPVWIEPGRFVAHPDETVDDGFTGLTWVQNPYSFTDAGPALWELALRRSKDLEWPEVNMKFDWRLPNVFEQVSLVDFSKVLGPDDLVSVFPPEFGIDVNAEFPLQTSTSSVRHPGRVWSVAPNNKLDDDPLDPLDDPFHFGGAASYNLSGFGDKMGESLFLPVRGPD